MNTTFSRCDKNDQLNHPPIPMKYCHWNLSQMPSSYFLANYINSISFSANNNEQLFCTWLLEISQVHLNSQLLQLGKYLSDRYLDI